MGHDTSHVEVFRWSPNSASIAFVSKVNNNSNPYGIEVYPNDNAIPQLFVIAAKPELQTPIQLSSLNHKVIGEVDFNATVEAFDWSPDNQKIAFSYAPEKGLDSRWKDSQIAIVDLTTSVIEDLPRQAPHQSIPRFSPDGKYLAFLKSDPQASYTFVRHVVLYSLAKGKFKQLNKTPDESPFLVGTSLLGWSFDGSSLLFLEPHRTKFALWSIPIHQGKITRLDNAQWTFIKPVLSRNRKWLGLSLETSSQAPEAYVTSSTHFSPKKVSCRNDHLKNWTVAPTEVIHWQSIDGQEIEGLITYPKNYVSGKRYPLLLVVHGGPMGAFFERYLGGASFYPLAAFADAGFVILRPNPRGSCGYGLSFRQAIIEDWGGIDYQDLMSGVDALIDRGIADSKNMGVMGWSYGGYMTAWIVTQTQRFAAASMGAGLSDLVSMAGTTDLHRFMPDYLGGQVWENPSLYFERSPITFAYKVTKPLLIQHGKDDERVPMSQSCEFFNTLRQMEAPVTMVLYPRSTHHITELQLRLDAVQRNFDWFVEKLGNRDTSK